MSQSNVESQSENSGYEPTVSMSRRDAFSRAAVSVFAASAAAATLKAPAASSSTPVLASAANVVELSNGGVKFPLAAFGLQVYDDETARKLTLTALEAGYRNFFASVLAGNQRGFAKAIKESGIPRGEIFICGSVVSNRAAGFDKARAATTRGWKENLNAFSVGNIDYLDQIMLDYPARDRDSIRGQWRAFEDMHAQGLTRTLSVSNFSPEQLDYILTDTATTVRPVVNQLPFSVVYHPDGVAETIEENRRCEELPRALLIFACVATIRIYGTHWHHSWRGR
jgi:aryl-alcohol dehydrogenase-like predicted oxidoreductase